MTYLLTATGLSPGGSITVHIYTQTTSNLEECGPCPVFAGFTLAFALQLSKKHGKPSVRVQYTYHQNTHTLQTHTHRHTHIHTTKPTHYKTTYRIVGRDFLFSVGIY